MIAVDASALVALLLQEPDWERFEEALVSDRAIVSPIGLWETAVRVRQVFKNGDERLARLIAGYDVRTVAIEARHADLALEAARRYGKGTPARLNLGDCFAYALAKADDLPLLYKGDDFARTDVRSVL